MARAFAASTLKKHLEILEKAEALINKGWCQNHAAENSFGGVENVFSSNAAKFCLRGALRRAGKDAGAVAKPYYGTRAGDHLCQFLFSPSHSLVVFNDAPGRKKGEIIALIGKGKEFLKERIKEIEAKEDHS